MDQAKDIYEQTIRHLPVMDRLRLAALILNGVAIPWTPDAPDDRYEETDQEATDLVQFLLKHAGRAVPLEKPAERDRV